MPVTWDEDNGDFDFGLSAAFAIPNNRLTVIPILLRSHWCAVEVNRTSHLVTVVVLGFPGPYFHTAVAAVARLLDFHPSRLAASIGPVANFPHMCGWVLLNDTTLNRIIFDRKISSQPWLFDLLDRQGPTARPMQKSTWT